MCPTDGGKDKTGIIVTIVLLVDTKIPMDTLLPVVKSALLGFIIPLKKRAVNLVEIKSQIETDGKLSGSLAQVEDVLAGSNNVQNWSEKYLAHRELLKKAGWTIA